MKLHVQGLGDLIGNRAFGEGGLKPVIPAEKIVRVYDPTDHECVGDGRLGAAPVIRRRSRVGACAMRPDLQSIPVGPGNAATAGADRDQFHRRQADGKTLIEKRLRIFFERIPVDKPDVETGAAHIRGDDLVLSQLVAEKTCRHQPGDGAGIDHRHRLASHIRRAPGAPCGRDDLYRMGQLVGRQPGIEILNISLRNRPHIGVYNGRDRTFEFAHARGDFMRQADRKTGRRLPNQGRYLLLMFRVPECP